ncbi:MAG: acyltransferase [Candidatus Norongarragalinales archaeon]
MSDYFVHPSADVSPRAKIGSGTKVWHQAQVREDAVVGERCVIGKNVYIDLRVEIGSGCKIQNNASVYFPAKIEDDVFIGPSVTFTNDLYPRAFLWDESRHSPLTRVRRGASIGADSVVIGGVEIGEYALVAAGSVVTRSVPPHGLVVGNPARLRGFVCKCGFKLNLAKARKKSGKRKAFVSAKCVKCGESTRIPVCDFEKLEK